MVLALLLDTQPPDFWHDSFGQFIATNAVTAISSLVTAFIGAGIAIWIYQKQRSKKEISYEIISDASVISIDQKIASQVEINLNGNPVKEVTLVVLKVSNTGNAGIKDYEDPLTFVFKGRKVISSEVIETEPKDLIDDSSCKTFIPISNQTQEYIEFPNFLLNPKQSVTFSVLLNGGKGEIIKKGRIIDGKIEKYEISVNSNLNYIMTAITFAFFSFLWYMISHFTGIAWFSSMANTFLGGTICVIVFLVSNVVRKSR